ncbi:hypothetical protein ACPA9J_02120 [Pseudomonas aeruginosa]
MDYLKLAWALARGRPAGRGLGLEHYLDLLLDAQGRRGRPHRRHAAHHSGRGRCSRRRRAG